MSFFPTVMIASALLKPFDMPNTLINGMPAEKNMFPEIVYIQTGFGACTGTVVGTKTILTAAHCIDPLQPKIKSLVSPEPFEATCEVPKSYTKHTDELDLALCIVDEGHLKIHPASISRDPVVLKQRMLLTGYGCTSKHGGGNDGILRVGLSTVSVLPGGMDDNWFWTYQDAAVCFGDSGGPAVVIYPEMEDETIHYVAGVNSRGDIAKESLLTALYLPKSIRFMKQWAESHNTNVCGVNKDCEDFAFKEVITRPPTPGPYSHFQQMEIKE